MDINDIKEVYGNLKKKGSNVTSIYQSIWKERCKMYKNESTIGIINQAPNRIVVIGDLHGDWNATVNTLLNAKLIKSSGNKYGYSWFGNDTIVVQLGDQIDRCRLDRGRCDGPNATINDEASDIKILEFFTHLHSQASKVGGAVYSIIGNHELMNSQGDFRYVSRENLLEFSNMKINPNNESEIKKKVEDGIKNRREQFKPGNKYANFLACTRRAALVIGSNLFIHAGIVPEIAQKYNVNDINRIIALFLFDKLKNPNKFNDLLINSRTSPLWTRLLGNLNKRNDKKIIEDICNSIFESGVLTNLLGNESTLKIERIFIGHTPQMFKGINTICGNPTGNRKKIYYVDVGVSQAFDSFDSNLQRTSKRSSTRNYPFIEIINDNCVNIK